MGRGASAIILQGGVSASFIVKTQVMDSMVYYHLNMMLIKGNNLFSKMIF